MVHFGRATSVGATLNSHGSQRWRARATLLVLGALGVIWLLVHTPPVLAAQPTAPPAHPPATVPAIAAAHGGSAPSATGVHASTTLSAATAAVHPTVPPPQPPATSVPTAPPARPAVTVSAI